MTGLLLRLRESAGALRERNFRLLWLGQTGSTFGDGLTFVAIAFAVIGLSGSATDIGLVFAAYSLPNVVFLLAGGVWADRLPRNLVMLTTDGWAMSRIFRMSSTGAGPVRRAVVVAVGRLVTCWPRPRRSPNA